MQQHFEQLLVSNYQSIPNSTRKVIKDRAIRASIKSQFHLNILYQQIENLENGKTKTYEVNGYFTAKRLLRFCEKKHIRAELIVDKNKLKNKVSKIVAGYNSSCCDTKPIFHHIKVPVMYVKVSK